MGAAFVRGSQGEDLSDPYTTAVCLKHFIGYGTPFNGKDRSPAHIPENYLRELYIPPFQKAIDEGALTVMINSGSVNGIPSHADRVLITEILKGEMGFEGFTISDWEDVVNLYKTHQVARDEREAVKLAVNAGLDMCMEPYDASFADHLVDLVNSGEVSMDRVDDAVRRILKVKKKLGLFDKLHPEADYSLYGSEEHAQRAYEAAVETVCLLKNEGSVLPLNPEKKYLITGVGAHSLNYLNGAWSRSWSGRTTEYNDEEKLTIFEAVESIVGSSNITYVEGTDYEVDINTSKAVQIARNSDIVIVCLGEIPATEKPSDIDDLMFPEVQLQMVKELSKAGKPIILVILEARPRIIRPIEPLADGICVSFLPGHEGGRAIADVLFGKQNPSGKLPVTYPRYSNSIWTYDHTKADKRDAGFGFDGFKPQYEFGHGLSYTSFAYSDLELSADTIAPGDTLRISVSLTNTGDRAGKEAVELYTSDLVASVVPAVKRLRRFEKYELEPGQTKSIEFTIMSSDLAFVNRENDWITEPGDYLIQIDTLQKKFYLNE
jgi:beta-glucosidase